MFNKLQAGEIQSIRQGFFDFKKEMGLTLDTDTSSNPCLFNCPPITFLVCMTRNKVKIVPATDNGMKNVFSGTCLDEIIMDFQTLKVTPPKQNDIDSSNLIYTEPDGKGYDFILVAHGGRMGTSKTVHYRCILNENAVWRPASNAASPLTKQTLEMLTYHMSFQYSTASKVSKMRL